MELSPREGIPPDPRVEEYLARVASQLPRTMSPACRLEHHAELAAHLQALAEAHIELGSDRETLGQEPWALSSICWRLVLRAITGAAGGLPDRDPWESSCFRHSSSLSC